MTHGRSPLYPGQLWTRIQEQTAYALNTGALQPISTDYEFIEQHDMRFLVRVLTNLMRKDQAQRKQKKATQTCSSDFNPFLPYETDLFVGDVSDTHLCLLNKYNVVDHHLLIVTREFESQTQWLTYQDFEALWLCLAEIDGLAFYNGGKLAGASQRHKHLQLVPTSQSLDGATIPVDAVIRVTDLSQEALALGRVVTLPNLPFAHAAASLKLPPDMPPAKAAQTLVSCYRQILDAVGLTVDGANPGVQSGAYNLLVKRDWMFIVPRSQESFHSISVNALGFAGSLFVRDEVQKTILKQHGPLTILSAVAASNGNIL